jgi:hypothetical protein
MMDGDKCGAIAGKLGKGNLSTPIKPAPVPLCPPQIPHDLTQARTLASAVELGHDLCSSLLSLGGDALSPPNTVTRLKSSTY